LSILTPTDEAARSMTVDSATTIELLLRGLAVGAQLAVGLVLARSASNRSLQWATLLFFAANIGFVLNGSAQIRAAIGPWHELFWFIQVGGAGWFWLFVACLFDDRRLQPLLFLPAAVLVALAVLARASPQSLHPGLWVAHNIIGLAAAGHAMLLIRRSAQADLVEARRRLRVPFIAVIALYSALLSAAQIGQIAGFAAWWYGLADSVAQSVLGLLGAAVLLEGRALLFGAAQPASASAAADPDGIWLERLDAVMTSQALWQREGLTIAALAAIVGLPEHRLRRLINDRLGHRNFPTFINGHRIGAAQRILADPAEATRSVASIAFDLGFGSLGPFNRAFRDATGLTPTEFRRRAFGDASPKPENIG
jgi:AraC-like DNA-binding protein